MHLAGNRCGPRMHRGVRGGGTISTALAGFLQMPGNDNPACGGRRPGAGPPVSSRAILWERIFSPAGITLQPPSGPKSPIHSQKYHPSSVCRAGQKLQIEYGTSFSRSRMRQ